MNGDPSSKMTENVTVEHATERDVAAIAAVLIANRNDASLFLRSQQDIARCFSDFIVARDGSAQLVGCAAIHRYGPNLAELVSVAVVPTLHGAGIGSLLVSRSLQKATTGGITRVWLATAKPTYFAQFGFRSMSRWALPLAVLLSKLKQVFQQPVAHWFPSLFARFTFMVRDA